MCPRELSITTRAPEQTEAVGAALAALLPLGSVAALRGDLATGKTCLVRGMAAALVGQDCVSSPTFTLVNQYGEEKPLYHLDLYRLSGPDEIADLGYEELFDSDGICVVEWAERAEAILPARRVDIFLSHVDTTTRSITIQDRGLLPPHWPAAIKAVLEAEAPWE
jgi:tRNA threonylcarbamoyladenosine biosynthesis protein TsaE